MMMEVISHRRLGISAAAAAAASAAQRLEAMKLIPGSSAGLNRAGGIGFQDRRHKYY